MDIRRVEFGDQLSAARGASRETIYTCILVAQVTELASHKGPTSTCDVLRGSEKAEYHVVPAMNVGCAQYRQ